MFLSIWKKETNPDNVPVVLAMDLANELDYILPDAGAGSSSVSATLWQAELTLGALCLISSEFEWWPEVSRALNRHAKEFAAVEKRPVILAIDGADFLTVNKEFTTELLTAAKVRIARVRRRCRYVVGCARFVDLAVVHEAAQSHSPRCSSTRPHVELG